MGREVPAIDISNFSERKDEIREQLMKAAVDIGFFAIVGHGIPQEMIDAQFDKAKQFFLLPDEVKAHYPMPKGRNAGWEKLAQVFFKLYKFVTSAGCMWLSRFVCDT